MFNMQERVHKIIKHLSGAVVAFSGGTDSAVLLRLAASALGDRLLAVSAVGPIYVPAETARARSLARAWGVSHAEVSLNQLLAAPRRIFEVRTAYGPVRVKVAYLDGRVIQVKPEFEDCRARAAEAGVPVRMVHAEASMAARRDLAAYFRDVPSGPPGPGTSP